MSTGRIKPFLLKKTTSLRVKHPFPKGTRNSKLYFALVYKKYLSTFLMNIILKSNFSVFTNRMKQQMSEFSSKSYIVPYQLGMLRS